VWDAGIETLKTEHCFFEHYLTIKPPKIRHCNPLRISHYTPMTSEKRQTSFRSRVEHYSARHIANAIGCSLPTAYDWRSGRRAPPAWMQDQIIADLASYHPQIHHDEKTA